MAPMERAALALVSFGLALPAPAGAQAPYGPITPAPAETHLANAETDAPIAPFGLAMIWRRDELRLGRDVPSRTTGSFALDGRFYALRNDSGVHVLDVDDGSVLGRWPAPSPQDAFSLAVSSNGQIAIGRVGRVEISWPGRSRQSTHFLCADACGPVLDVAFSPDGRLLAYQGTRGLRDRQRGLGYAVVLDAQTGGTVARLEAIAARAFVAFSPDGHTLVASNATSFDETEMFGLRTWRTSDWALTRNLAGTTRRWRGVGRLADSEFVAAYERDGRLEVVDLATERPLWSVPLVADALDTAASGETRLALVELAPNGAFVLSYETPRLVDPRGNAPGTLVIRDGASGEVVALYDVSGVTDVAIAPDSRTFAYSTRSGESHTVLARVPL